MNNRNYYYLVAGLPDLALEQSKLPFSPLDFIEMLRELLHPVDFQLVEWLLYPHDHLNLLALVRKESVSWKPGGKFSRQEMEEYLKEPGRLPAYIEQFYEAWKDDSPVWPLMSWENQLTSLYYEAAIENTAGFMREWLIFDRQLRNILAAWNIRTHRLSSEGQIIGRDQVTEAIEKSHTRDFGLSGEFLFLDRLLHVLEQDDLLEREKAIDRIRWNHIDELNTFHYFNVDIVLGYLLKLLILERWVGLHVESGKTAIDNLIGELENSFEFPEKYT